MGARELVQETRFSQAGLPDDRNDLSLTFLRPSQEQLEVLEFDAAADKAGQAALCRHLEAGPARWRPNQLVDGVIDRTVGGDCRCSEVEVSVRKASCFDAGQHCA